MYRLLFTKQVLQHSIFALQPSRKHGYVPSTSILREHHASRFGICVDTAAFLFKRFHSHANSRVDDTIYALSTASGRAAIAVVRISGPACLSVYHQLCPDRSPPKPRAATLRKLRSPIDSTKVLDTGALLLYFPSPNTVTGEDVLELHLHGGPAIVRSVLEAIPQCANRSLQEGNIRPAESGEFTKRAFYNGRIDLTEVEALGEALAAETDQQQRLAVSGAATGLTSRYEEWRSMLLYARGELEALIDFSEDQHFDESPKELMASVTMQVASLKEKLDLHILNAGRGELLRSGIDVALLGAPNAGKSSLLNRIVGREAAIVSAEAGTTRDIVDVNLDIQGWLVRLGDMAGVRTDFASAGLANAAAVTDSQITSVGQIEQEGIRRARERALISDLVIVLISLKPTSDGTVELDLNEELVMAVQACHVAKKNIMFAINKIDLLHTQTARKKVSISRLLSQLIETFPMVDPNEVFCLSCSEASNEVNIEPDAGGLKTFLDGLVNKFSSMTSAATGVLNETATSITAAEAQSYWTASLSVTHRQSRFLQQCRLQLQDFLGISSPGNDTHVQNDSQHARPVKSNSSTSGRDFFDIGNASPTFSEQSGYYLDHHDDLVAEMNDNSKHDFIELPTLHTTPATTASTTCDGSNPNFTGLFSDDEEEIDIVTAAEYLRSAADCLSKLTGRGDGVTTGADVEDVLGVVFEKTTSGRRCSVQCVPQPVHTGNTRGKNCRDLADKPFLTKLGIATS